MFFISHDILHTKLSKTPAFPDVLFNNMCTFDKNSNAITFCFYFSSNIQALHSKLKQN